MRLPIGPFREWLNVQLNALSREELAEKLGVDPRVLYRWLHEGRTVALDAADEALVKTGTHLSDLWPEIYEERSQWGTRPLTKLRDETLEEALALYETKGLSLYRVAEMVYPKSEYKNLESCYRSLRHQFRSHGWMRPLSRTMQIVYARKFPPNKCPGCGSEICRESSTCHGCMMKGRIVWTERLIIEAIQAWAQSHGRLPRCADWQTVNHPYPSYRAAQRRFGSWATAIKAAQRGGEAA